MCRKEHPSRYIPSVVSKLSHFLYKFWSNVDKMSPIFDFVSNKVSHIAYICINTIISASKVECKIDVSSHTSRRPQLPYFETTERSKRKQTADLQFPRVRKRISSSDRSNFDSKRRSRSRLQQDL